MSDPKRYRLRWQGRISGPFPIEVLLSRLDDGEIGIYHEIEHQDTWVTLQDFLKQRDEPTKPEDHSPRLVPKPVSGLPPSGTDATSAPPASQPPPHRHGRSKRRSVFVICGFVLGFLGVHNFYAGYWGTAVIQCVATVILATLGFGIFFTWVWALIELLVVHSDSQGTPLT